MDPVEHVVAQTVRAKRATIADAVVENIPRVRDFFAVFPDDAEHLAIVLRFGLTDKAERHHTREPGIVGFRSRHSSINFRSPILLRRAVRPGYRRTLRAGFLRSPSCIKHSADAAPRAAIPRA